MSFAIALDKMSEMIYTVKYSTNIIQKSENGSSSQSFLQDWGMKDRKSYNYNCHTQNGPTWQRQCALARYGQEHNPLCFLRKGSDMLDTTKLSDSELHKLMSKPVSKNYSDRIRKLREKAKWLFTLSFQEGGKKVTQEQSPIKGV